MKKMMKINNSEIKDLSDIKRCVIDLFFSRVNNNIIYYKDD